MSVNEVRLRGVEAFKIRGTGDPTSRTFCIGNQDHTLGNSLRHVLLQNAKVEFAGYSVPHPAEPVVNIRVQTRGPTTAVEALRESCETLHGQCDFVLKKMMEKLPEIKTDREAVDAILETMQAEEDDEDDASEMPDLNEEEADAMEED